MTRKERIAALSAAHGSGEAPTEAPEVKDEKPEVDFDDPVTQEEILNPNGSDVELSYGKIRLYPPSAMVRRLAYGFCTDILADVAASNATNVNAFSMRVLSTLMSSAAPQIRMFRLIAQMCGRPGTIDEKQQIELSTEIAEKASPDDMAVLFERLSVAAGISKGLKAKK